MNPDIHKLLFICSLTGRLLKLPFNEARRLLYECSIGWVKRIEWLRYDFDGLADANYLTPGIPEAGAFSGYHIMIRGRNWLTIDKYRELYEEQRLSIGAFAAHVSRFRKAFEKSEDKKVNPFEHQRRNEGARARITAYRLRPPLTALVIIDVDPDSGFTGDDIDWTMLLDR